MTAALSAETITVGYGDRDVLTGFDFELRDNEVLCLVGHNGAGKSTLLKALFGLMPLRAGQIRMAGEVVEATPSTMASAGIAYLPEGRGVFPGLSVSETFTLAAWSAGLSKGEMAERIDDVIEILPALRNFWTQRAGTLSGGQQQMVSLGRALLSRPRLLLLDEPSVGLAPKLFQDLLVPVRQLQAERKLSILLVEQNIREAFGISDRVVVMKSGEIVFAGLPAELEDRARLLELF